MEYKTILDKPPDYEKVKLGKEFLSIYLFLSKATKYREKVPILTSSSLEKQINQEDIIRNKREMANTVDLIVEYITIKQQHEKILSEYINIDDIKTETSINEIKSDEKPKPILNNKPKKRTANKISVEKTYASSEVIEELKNIDEELRSSVILDAGGIALKGDDGEAIILCTNCKKYVPKTMLCLYCGSPILFHVSESH